MSSKNDKENNNKELVWIDPKEVSKFLKNWHNVKILATQKLIFLEVVTNALNTKPNPNNTLLSRATTLKALLQQIIEELKPENTELEQSNKYWRNYYIIKHRFLLGESIIEVAEDLAIEISTYNHSQSEAINLLAAKLSEWELKIVSANKNEKLSEFDVPGITKDKPLSSAKNNISNPNNLRHYLGTFVGRTHEMEEVKNLILSKPCRLLTLSGTGGVGKTRLAIEAGLELVSLFTDGVWVIELASISNVLTANDEILKLLANTLGINVQNEASVFSTITQFIKTKNLLLILDNCEHIINNVVGIVTELLQNCPELKVLTTSREILNISDEMLIKVDPLPVPAPSLKNVSTGVLLEYDAIRLFVTQARIRQSSFSFTEQNAATVTEICQTLEGIPLAIELVATKIIAFSLNDILNSLLNTMELLKQGKRGTIPRHRTLQSVIDWSYNLLEENEKILLRRLAVFRGGWSVKAAQLICSDKFVVQEDIAGYLLELTKKSMVVAQINTLDGETRHNFLEIIRQYAYVKLDNAGEVEGTRIKQAKWLLAFIKEARPNLDGVQQGVWLDKLERELGNIRVILEWACQKSHNDLNHSEIIETAAEITATLLKLWYYRGYIREGRFWLEQFLIYQSNLPLVIKAMVFNAAGVLAYVERDFTQSQKFHELSLESYTALGNEAMMGAALGNLGLLAREQGDYAKAVLLDEQNLQIQRKLGNKEYTAITLNNLGLIAEDQGRFNDALTLHKESLMIRREIGDKSGIGYSLSNLGNVKRAEKKYVEARAFYEESLAIRREINQKEGLVLSLKNLAILNLIEKKYSESEQLCQEAISIADEAGLPGPLAILECLEGDLAFAQNNMNLAQQHYHSSLISLYKTNDKLAIARTLFGLANVACNKGEFPRSIRLLAAFDTLCKSIGAFFEYYVEPDFDDLIKSLSAKVSQKEFSSYWQIGSETQLEQLILSEAS